MFGGIKKRRSLRWVDAKKPPTLEIKEGPDEDVLRALYENGQKVTFTVVYENNKDEKWPIDVKITSLTRPRDWEKGHTGSWYISAIYSGNKLVGPYDPVKKKGNFTMLEIKERR